MQSECCRVYSVESDVGYWSFWFLKLNRTQIFGNIWPTPAGKVDVVEYVLWSRMWAIQQYARPSIHQELSGMLPSIYTSCNTYTLNINTRFILSVIIFISMFYWIPLEHSDQITFPFLLIVCQCLPCTEDVLNICAEFYTSLTFIALEGLPKSKNIFRSFEILFYEVSFWILQFISKCRD